MLVALRATVLWLSFRTACTPFWSVREVAVGGTRHAPPRTSIAIQTAMGIGWVQRSNGQSFDGRKAGLHAATFAVNLNHTKRSWEAARPLPSITATRPIANGAVSVVAAIRGLVSFETNRSCCSTRWSISEGIGTENSSFEERSRYDEFDDQ